MRRAPPSVKVRLQNRIGEIFAYQLWMALITQTSPSISSLFAQPSNAPDS